MKVTRMTWKEFKDLVEGDGIGDDEILSDLNVDRPCYVDGVSTIAVWRDPEDGEGVVIEWQNARPPGSKR